MILHGIEESAKVKGSFFVFVARWGRVNIGCHLPILCVTTAAKILMDHELPKGPPLTINERI